MTWVTICDRATFSTVSNSRFISLEKQYGFLLWLRTASCIDRDSWFQRMTPLPVGASNYVQ